MPNVFQLPLVFDAAPLQADLNNIEEREWSSHFNTGYFQGDWSGVALRSIGGVSTQLYPDPHAAGEIEDTPILKACPSIQKVLSGFNCDIKSARLLRLGPGSSIKEHRDYELGRETGEIRLHIPVVSNEHVEFYLAGRRVDMKEGECWYLDFSLPHRVENRGSTVRIHLVVDCVINEWLESLFPSEDTEQNNEHTSSPAQLQEFRSQVWTDLDLQEKLRATDDSQSFIDLVVQIGRECGYIFCAGDVRDFLSQERGDLLKTWIE